MCRYVRQRRYVRPGRGFEQVWVNGVRNHECARRAAGMAAADRSAPHMNISEARARDLHGVDGPARRWSDVAAVQIVARGGRGRARGRGRRTTGRVSPLCSIPAVARRGGGAREPRRRHPLEIRAASLDGPLAVQGTIESLARPHHLPATGTVAGDGSSWTVV